MFGLNSFFVHDKNKFMLAVLLLTISTFIFNIINIAIHIIYAKKLEQICWR